MHGARGENVDAPVGDFGEVLGVRLYEAAPVRDTKCARGLSAEIEQITRDVGENDVRGAALERAEADQALAAADIQQGLSLHQLGSVENLLAEGLGFLQHPAANIRIAAAAVHGEPFGPDVSTLLGHLKRAQKYL